MKTALIALLAAITWGTSIAQERTAPTRPTRYQVSMNLEEGIVADVYVQVNEYLAIPSSTARVGGGGRDPIVSKKWIPTNKQVFFPHTAQTMDLENDAIIYAETRPTGKGHRVSGIQVVPMHTIVRILPPPAPEPRKQTTRTTPAAPADPFQKKRTK